ncbi:ATP-binding protein [Streptomyces violaceusniger]|uniref:ATP-binding protein n=1 Tax=Streptomyces violaceusniger TaxID=68280 RepID=UPI0009972F30|nr:ATP-binding protein [Streptomyces hygroscopicus]AQW53390.1 PAS/PAC sensor protein [Streptomyces hygroscopicus]
MSEPYEVKFRLPRRRSSVPRARALLHSVLADWGVGQEAAEVGELVLSELVTNALRVRVPNDRLVEVRIARLVDEGVLRLEVSDAGEGKPEVRKPDEDETGGRGLLLVEALAHRWGYERRACGIGKTVWVELKAPDLVSERDGVEIAALAVRVGQRVRVWGEWRTVRNVGTQQRTSGGLTVVLALDDGSAVRIDAAEPLTVRDAGASFSPRGTEDAPG